jgi:hypothetical protein
MDSRNGSVMHFHFQKLFRKSRSMVIEGVLVTEEKQKRKQIVMKGEEEVLWGLGRENAKTNSFGQSKRQKENGRRRVVPM